MTHLRAHKTPKERAEASLHEFVRQAWSIVESDCPFIDGWHIRAICEHLEAVADGRIKRLLINVPPGCGKSLLVCVFWACWVWGPQNRPHTRWLFASYGQELSTRDSLKCRQILESDWYQEYWGDRVQLVADQNQKTKFQNSAGGWRLATSTGGRGTGEHPDFVVWDDPHNVNDVESQVERERVSTWRAATITLRGMARDVREVGIMQRLHRDDLSGWMLNTHKEGLDHLCLPMRYEESAMPKPTSIGWIDPRVTADELLWPAVVGKARLVDMENQLGPYAGRDNCTQPPPTRLARTRLCFTCDLLRLTTRSGSMSFPPRMNCGAKWCPATRRDRAAGRPKAKRASATFAPACAWLCTSRARSTSMRPSTTPISPRPPAGSFPMRSNSCKTAPSWRSPSKPISAST